MLLEKDDSLLAIIDIQERLHPHISKGKELTENTIRLIKGAKILGLPMLITQQYTKGLGETIPEIVEALGDVTPIEKSAFSSYREPQFAQALKSSGRKQIILAGIETHVCLLQTAIDSLEAGYTPIIVADCVSSRKRKNHKRALRRMENEGAIITGCESILFELLKEAGTPEFKAISALVK
jgi:nicotinamidase-related amidase